MEVESFMSNRSFFSFSCALVLSFAGLSGTTLLYAASAGFASPAVDLPLAPSKGHATAVFSGGCFWGVEGVFEHVKGVTDVVAGYSGGSPNTAHYEIVSTGETGHAESVQITYDPSKISYGTLLKIFFSVAHDPTQLNRQNYDVGTQYRSAIFYSNEDQKRVAEAYIQQLEAAKVFSSKIVTQLVPLKQFYRAEDHHQHFMALNPDYPYIVHNDLPKLKDLQSKFPELAKK